MSVKNQRRKNKADMTVSEQLEAIAEEMCNHYCKYPDLWNEEAEGCELSESEHCRNCPLGRL